MGLGILAILDLAFPSVKWDYKIPFPEFPFGFMAHLAPALL